jgi:transposase-like protein
MQKKKRKQYTAAFKAKVVTEMLKEEKTVGQLAAEYEVLSLMLYRWRDQVLAGLPGLWSRSNCTGPGRKRSRVAARTRRFVCRDRTLNHATDVVGKKISRSA